MQLYLCLSFPLLGGVHFPVPRWEYGQILWPFCWFGGKSPNLEIIRHVQGETSLLPSQTSGRWHDVPHGNVGDYKGVRRDKEVPPWHSLLSWMVGGHRATSSHTGAFLDPLRSFCWPIWPHSHNTDPEFCPPSTAPHDPWPCAVPTQTPSGHPSFSLLTFSRC